MPGPLRDPSPRARARLLDELRGRDDGSSAERAADIAVTPAGARRSEPYESWTVADLRRRAAELGIPGRSTLRKAGLIEALRSH